MSELTTAPERGASSPTSEPYRVEPPLETAVCGVCSSSRYEFLFSSQDYLYGNKGTWPVARCLDCGVVYMNPRIPPAEIGNYYPKTYYTYAQIDDPVTNVRKRAVYNTVARQCLGYPIPAEEIPVFSRRARLALPFIRRHKYASYIPTYVPNGRILDVGCGNGILLCWYRYLGWKTHGLEISPESARISAQFGHEMVTGELQEAKYGSESFDAVTMWDALEHIHNPQEVIGEIYRILKPGGKLYLCVPNFGSIYGRMFKDEWMMFTSPVHYYHYSAQTLTELLHRCGFKDVKITYPLGDAGIMDTVMTFFKKRHMPIVAQFLASRSMSFVRRMVDHAAPRGHLRAEASR